MAQLASMGQDEFVAMIHAQNEQCAMAVEQRAGNHQALSGCCCESETAAEKMLCIPREILMRVMIHLLCSMGRRSAAASTYDRRHSSQERFVA